MGVKPDVKATDVRLLDRIRSTPTGRLALKIGVGVLGGLVVAVGIVLIPFPGPGWAIVILGLAILAVEFVWAKNLLAFTKRHVKNWTQWIGRQSLPMRGLIGVVGMVFVAAIVYFAVRLSLGIDLIQVGQDFVDKH
ncbi:TIGR02611 family protein [Actinoplanes sp. L3-i22]|uniref:TIGR02611 family protein n=1 Tax=Actinoplanes sp. L3-i22 TaxID=2836373 RepID=UPI001C799A00|nr:TIGR02611 family protein [Actinoplanes sp. L3-i22]BCY13981.1 hypothetical protein L3i22_090690 [Actinoplanes sp. L3-i22]